MRSIPQPTVSLLKKTKEERPGIKRRAESEILKHKSQIRDLIKLHRDKKYIAPWRTKSLSYQTLSDYAEYGILKEKRDGSYEYVLTKKFKEFLVSRGISPSSPSQDVVDFLKFEPVYLDVQNKMSKIESENQDFSSQISDLQNSIYWNFRKIEKLKSKLSCVNRRAARERYRKIPITRNIPDIDDICTSLQSPK